MSTGVQRAWAFSLKTKFAKDSVRAVLRQPISGGAKGWPIGNRSRNFQSSQGLLRLLSRLSKAGELPWQCLLRRAPAFRGSIARGVAFSTRSEERRVGKECRSRVSPDHVKKKKDKDAIQM